VALTGFKRATGTTGIVVFVLAILAYPLLALGHPVYAVFIPPLIVGGIVYAFIRSRDRGHPSIRAEGPGEAKATTKPS